VTDKPERYTRTSVRSSAGKLLGNTLKMLTFDRTDTGYEARSGNLHAVFSSFDGSAESFLHIRLGIIPEVYYDEDELADYANSLLTGTLGVKDPSLIFVRLETFCGFTKVEFETDMQKIITVLDSHGRLWALEKVKR
jgi:hypothetical protein